MRCLLLILFILPFAGGSNASSKAFTIPAEKGSWDLSDRVKVLKDLEDTLTPRDILNNPLPFRKVREKSPNLSFSDGGYWVEFKIRNEGLTQERFLLEAARAITNRVDLYPVRAGKVTDTLRSGDHTPLSEKAYTHRKSIFPLHIPAGETRRYLLNLKSHGETIILPMILRDPATFNRIDRDHQFFNGIYYGVMVLILFIFSFFYYVSRDRSFLHYVLWVLAIGASQFSVDGYSYRWLFSGNPWLVDRSVRTLTIVSIFFVSLYAKEYLKTRERVPWIDSIYNGILWVAAISVLTSLTTGPLYVLTHPFINGFSFFTALFILFSIGTLKRKGYAIPIPFSLAFLFLVVGVILFLSGNSGLVQNTAFFRNSLKFGTLSEMGFLSIAMALKYRELQEEKEKAQADALKEMDEKKRMVDRYNQELEEKVRERTEALDREKEKLTEVNQEIMSSIRYAQRIQNAILPSHTFLNAQLPESFILFKPRDHVSGDFYWVARNPRDETILYFAAVDCTGHGVPGAFLSLMGNDIMNQCLKEIPDPTPKDFLNYLDRTFKEKFARNEKEEELKDGMDIALCRLDKKTGTLRFAGTHNPLYHIREGTLTEVLPDKRSIGHSTNGAEAPFTEQEIHCRENDALYLFSDGYADQFGGDKGKKFKYRRFKELLQGLQKYSMAHQKKVLEDTIEEWRGDLEQVDDILVFGVRT